MIVQFQDFYLEIGNRKVLRALNLSLEKGKSYSIVGRNGAGKTQLLRVIAGLQGENTSIRGLRRVPENVGYVFQSPTLFPWLTVFENLLFVAPSLKSKALEYLRQFQVDQYVDSYPYQLSGGTKQKINIIRAFLVEAPLVVLDEPFVALDLPQKQELLEMIAEISNVEKTILLVTHDIDEALVLANRLFFLSKDAGSITKEWTLGPARGRTLDSVRVEDWARLAYAEIKAALEGDGNV